MPWGRMDDKFHRNRKVRALRRAKGGREALGTWAYWWSWCLDDPDLTGVVPADELDDPELKSAQLLVRHGLWDEVEGGYRFHDFHEYNPTRGQVDKKKTADRERVAVKRSGGKLAGRENVARDSLETREVIYDESRASSGMVLGESLPRDARWDGSHSLSDSSSDSDAHEHSGPATLFRVPLPEPLPDQAERPLSSRVREGYESRYLKRYGAPPNQEQTPLMVPKVCAWITSVSEMRDLDEYELCNHLLDAFFAHPKAIDNRHRPGYLATDPGEWLDAPRSRAKPLSQEDIDSARSPIRKLLPRRPVAK